MWHAIPRWDEGCQTPTPEEVDAHVSCTECGAFVSVLRVEFSAYAGIQEDKAMAKHPGNAKVQDLRRIGRDGVTREKNCNDRQGTRSAPRAARSDHRGNGKHNGSHPTR